MVSNKISNACYPITVKMGKGMKDGTLVLNVIHGKEMEVEYAKNEIIDKINSFFGYNCIKSVKLKIIQEKIKINFKDNSEIKDFKKIEEKMKLVKDNQLKNSLKNLLKAYNEKNN